MDRNFTVKYIHKFLTVYGIFVFRWCISVVEYVKHIQTLAHAATQTGFIDETEV